MLRPLRTPRAGFLALALAALTLLPPTGWAVCVAPGGHVQVEPVSTEGASGCCTLPEPAPARDQAAAAGSDCDACHDLMAFSGDAARCRVQDDATPLVDAPFLVPVACSPEAVAAAVTSPLGRLAAPPGARLATVILRN